MTLWKRIRSIWGESSSSKDPMSKVETNILATSESREAAQQILQEGMGKLREGIQSSEKVVAGYDELLKRSSEYDQKFKAMEERENQLQAGLTSLKQSLSERSSQLSERSSQLTLLQKKYRAWKENWSLLDPNAIDYKKKKQILTQEREALEKELKSLSSDSATS